MAIAFSNLGASTNPDILDAVDRSSYSNSSWTPPTSGLIWVYVYNIVSGTPNQPTISGNSLTWTAIKTQLLGTTYRLTLFGADAAGSSTGVTTVDMGGQSQFGCCASFGAAAGVDLSGGVTAAFVQSPTASGFAAPPQSVTLAGAAHADNRPILGAGISTNTAHTPRANWTELDELNMGGVDPFCNLSTQYRDDAFETTASVTWTNTTNYILVAAELKAIVAAPSPRKLRVVSSPLRW